MRRRFAVLSLALVLVIPSLAPALSPVKGDDAALAARIDAVMADIYKPGQPGAAIIVRREGRTILRQGYGLADLELGVAVEPDMVFRIGSVTKQFTAAAVLLLAQEGRLGLQDEITKFLPDYPTGGRTITVEHLLTHTSGIQSYTEMPEWLPLMRKDFSLKELIGLFKDKPMQFEPGERWVYNNSGYILLGAVIEKASGTTYEKFLEERIFKPLGLAHTRYDRTDQVIPRRARGYQAGAGGFVNAPYLSMTQPHAAGALLSSVDDLAAWTEALFSGKLLRREWLDRAFTPVALADGESTGYGYGWFISDFKGHRAVEHGGGIPGFTSYIMCFPEDGITIAILTNSAFPGRQPEPRAVRIANLLLGLSEPERQPVPLPGEVLDGLTGVYVNDQKIKATVTREGDRAFLQRQGRVKNELLALSPEEFFTADNPDRILAVRDVAGNVTGLRVVSRIGPAQMLRKEAAAVPPPRREAVIDPRVLDRYVGDYELAPDFLITILRKDNRLISRATGQPQVELFPESETRFFLKAVDGQVDFVLDAEGRVTGLVVHQGGQDLPARKVRRP